MAYFFVPAHSHEETDPVDNLGGLLSLIMVGSLTLAINFSTVRSMRTEVLVLAALVFITGAWFVYRQLHEAHPLYDLRVASRRTFWVAACSGTIVFGALMGAIALVYAPGSRLFGALGAQVRVTFYAARRRGTDLLLVS